MTRTIKRMGLFVSVLVLLAILIGGRFYRYINGNNVDISKAETPYIYIPNGTSFSELKCILEESSVVKDMESFVWVAQKKNYITRIKGGRYKLEQGMSNNQLINLLRSGKQEPLNITFNNIRKLEQLASVVGKKIMADSVELVNLLSDRSYIKECGFNKQTFPTMFIPNTYQMYWNSDAKHFVQRMELEYKRFWTDEKKDKAKAVGLSPVEVGVLASIVDEETQKSDEKPMVAGLYLNRLKKGMKLQADPTLKYALGDFTIKRLLNEDKNVDSPYNTYKYYGLPPGPIRIPSITGINAVLNHSSHNYLYMCAKEDFSGYHNFAKTLRQHNQNAAKYQRELNKRGIRR
ncbi:endolytic transglycosylase MltG [Labilibacter sediminis]|nr:endolytic transglycosylase MltG [Labilibacter sediminis]